MRRRGKIRLPDAEARDVIALSNELVDFSENDESVFSAERLRAAREFEGHIECAAGTRIESVAMLTGDVAAALSKRHFACRPAMPTMPDRRDRNSECSRHLSATSQKH